MRGKAFRYLIFLYNTYPRCGVYVCVRITQLCSVHKCGQSDEDKEAGALAASSSSFSLSLSLSPPHVVVVHRENKNIMLWRDVDFLFDCASSFYVFLDIYMYIYEYNRRIMPLRKAELTTLSALRVRKPAARRQVTINDVLRFIIFGLRISAISGSENGRVYVYTVLYATCAVFGEDYKTSSFVWYEWMVSDYLVHT
jgi:hypothetical protein